MCTIITIYLKLNTENTWQISNLKVPNMHKKLTLSTYLYIGPKMYNILSWEIKHSKSFKILKKKITL